MVFGSTSVSLGLHLHDGLDASSALLELREDARVAAEAGFDGVSLGEHHAGFPGYVPNPVLASAWLLQSLDSIWVAAAPVLVAARSPHLVAEDIAWTMCMYPGRFGAAFAPGYRESDFLDRDFPRDLAGRYSEALSSVVEDLSGRPGSPIADDRAIRQYRAAPVPLLSAVGSVTASRRAASHGLGVYVGAFGSPEHVRRLFSGYRDAGGQGPRVLIRKVWIGEDGPWDSYERQVEMYRAGAPAGVVVDHDGGGLVTGSVDSVRERLREIVSETGPTALNLRVHLPGSDVAAVREQVALLGSEVLGDLRAHLASE